MVDANTSIAVLLVVTMAAAGVAMACGSGDGSSAPQQCGVMPSTTVLAEKDRKHPKKVGLAEGTPVSEGIYDNMDRSKADEFSAVHSQMLPDQATGQQFIRDKDIKGFAMEDNVTPDDIQNATDNQVMFRQYKTDGPRRPAVFLLRPPPDVTRSTSTATATCRSGASPTASCAARTRSSPTTSW